MLLFIIFVISMAALIYGADFIVDEAEKLAKHFNISKFIIGATLVAIGTSLPEIASAIAANLNNSSGLIIPNVIGSNIFNIILILGLIFTFIKNIKFKRNIYKKDSIWILLPLLIFFLLSIDGVFSLLDGIFLLLMMLGYIYYLLISNKLAKIANEKQEASKQENKNDFNYFKSSLCLLAGFIMLVIGAKFVIYSAEQIALMFGISEWVIGIILLAFGTSLPELAVSISAAKKQSIDIIIGNIIGSNMANLTAVVGIAALFGDIAFDMKNYAFDCLMVIGVSIMLIFTLLENKSFKAFGLIYMLFFMIFVGNIVLNI